MCKELTPAVPNICKCSFFVLIMTSIFLGADSAWNDCSINRTSFAGKFFERLRIIASNNRNNINGNRVWKISLKLFANMRCGFVCGYRKYFSFVSSLRSVPIFLCWYANWESSLRERCDTFSTMQNATTEMIYWLISSKLKRRWHFPSNAFFVTIFRVCFFPAIGFDGCK